MKDRGAISFPFRLEVEGKAKPAHYIDATFADRGVSRFLLRWPEQDPPALSPMPHGFHVAEQLNPGMQGDADGVMTVQGFHQAVPGRFVRALATERSE